MNSNIIFLIVWRASALAAAGQFSNTLDHHSSNGGDSPRRLATSGTKKILLYFTIGCIGFATLIGSYLCYRFGCFGMIGGRRENQSFRRRGLSSRITLFQRIHQEIKSMRSSRELRPRGPEDHPRYGNERRARPRRSAVPADRADDVERSQPWAQQTQPPQPRPQQVHFQQKQAPQPTPAPVEAPQPKKLCGTMKRIPDTTWFTNYEHMLAGVDKET